MIGQETDRVRKLVIRDHYDRVFNLETADTQTMEYLENVYREKSGLATERFVLADAATRNVLGDRSDRIKDLWPQLGSIEIIAMPDATFAAGL